MHKDMAACTFGASSYSAPFSRPGVSSTLSTSLRIFPNWPALNCSVVYKFTSNFTRRRSYACILPSGSRKTLRVPGSRNVRRISSRAVEW